MRYGTVDSLPDLVLEAYFVTVGTGTVLCSFCLLLLLASRLIAIRGLVVFAMQEQEGSD